MEAGKEIKNYLDNLCGSLLESIEVRITDLSVHFITDPTFSGGKMYIHFIDNIYERFLMEYERDKPEYKVGFELYFSEENAIEMVDLPLLEIASLLLKNKKEFEVLLTQIIKEK